MFTGGSYHQKSQRVLRDSALDKVANTNRAYEPKMNEFKQFCANVYGNDDYAQTVTEDKSFAVSFYHGYRNKISKSSLSCTGDEFVRFDRNEYDKVVLTANQDGDNDNIGNIIGLDMVNQYWCAVKIILRHQRAHNANYIWSDDLDSECVNWLMEKLGKRKNRVARSNCKERTYCGSTPYKMIFEVNQIEDYMWN